MQGTTCSTSFVHDEEFGAHVTYWGLKSRRESKVTQEEKKWTSLVGSHLNEGGARASRDPSDISDDDRTCSGPPSAVLEALESGNVDLLADILSGCRATAVEDRQHVLLEFSFSRTDAGSSSKWPNVTLRALPEDWQCVTKQETFPWAMLYGTKEPLEAELLLGSKTNLFTQGPTVSKAHVCHIVARGPECQSSDDVRTLLFQALTCREMYAQAGQRMNALIGAADTYSPPTTTTDGKHSGYPFLASNDTLCDSVDHMGVINIEKGAWIWVEVPNFGVPKSFCATVVTQEGQAVTVDDGSAELEIDLLFERVVVDNFWEYKAETKSFERKRGSAFRNVGEEPGLLSMHRTPFSPWQPPEGEQPRFLRDCGVSIGWLESFISGSDMETYSSFDVADRIVKPATEDNQCRYVEALPETEVGRATYFVSHRWGAHFANMVRSILRYHHTHGRMSASPRQRAFVWLDLFAVNQHAKAEDLKMINQVVDCAKQTLLCIDVECQVLTRLWCVYEVWHTLGKGATRTSVETPGWNTPTLQVIACGDDSEDRAEAQRRISKLWMTISTHEAVTEHEADSKRLRNAMREVDDPISLDLQIMSALCNTGDYMSGIRMSMLIPPWASTEAGAAFSEDRCMARSEKLIRQRLELLASSKSGWSDRPAVG